MEFCQDKGPFTSSCRRCQCKRQRPAEGGLENCTERGAKVSKRDNLQEGGRVGWKGQDR